MAKIRRSGPRTSENEGLTIKQSFEMFIESRKTLCSAGTYDFYRQKTSVVCDLLGAETQTESLSPMDIREALSNYRESHTDGGAFKIYSVIRAWINWYWNEFDIELRNPIDKVSVRNAPMKPKEGITRAEIDGLLESIQVHSKFPERDIGIVMVLCDTGIRRRSLAELKMKDLDVERAQFTCHEKDQQYHIKAFGVQTQRALRKYLACLEDVSDDDPLWLNQDGTPMTDNSMKKMLMRMANAGGLKQHLFHDFRRFYGLSLYQSTKDIFMVSRALDHKNVEVTKRYLAIDQLEDLENLRRIAPMDNGKTDVKTRIKKLRS